MPLTCLRRRVGRCLLLACMGMPLVTYLPSALASPVGLAAPPFSLLDERGVQVGLEQYRGKVVYLDFWASWCGPCRQSFPWMNSMQATYRDRGLHIVAINVDAKAVDAKKFLAETPAQFEVLYDGAGKTPRAYGVKGMPSSYLIDRQGRIVSVHNGFTSAKAAELEAQLKQLLEAK